MELRKYLLTGGIISVLVLAACGDDTTDDGEEMDDMEDTEMEDPLDETEDTEEDGA